MKTMHKYVIGLALFSFFSLSCTTNSQMELEGRQMDTLNFVNLTVLLDLSNRIDSAQHPDQIQRDTLIIRNVLNNFSDQVRKNGYIYSKDKIQVLIAPQADNKPITFNPHIDIEEISKSNKIVRQVLQESETEFIKEIKDIYSSKQVFTGADIWTFFKDFPETNYIQKSYAEKGNDNSVFLKFHNKMIIITDGYLNFEPRIQTVRTTNNSCMQMEPMRHDKNWEQNFVKFKLKPIAGKNFQNLEVLLLEVNPIHPEINLYESEIIDAYWRQWFADMNIGYAPLHQASEGIPLINSTVKTFINNN